MLKKMTALLRDEEGQGMVEYGLILSLIGVAAIVTMKALGVSVNGIFTSTTTELTGS